MLIMKYERRNFFGQRIYTEDSISKYSRDDVKKAMLYFSKAHDVTVQIDDTVIYWGTLSDFENRIVTVRDYDGMNYTEKNMSFEKIKKDIYSRIQ